MNNTYPPGSVKKFWVFAIAYLVTSIADMVITYVGTPDLLLEANPLVTVFGLGWGALITANILGYIIYIALIYCAFIKYKRKVLQCEGLKQYLSMLYYDRPDKFKWIWYKFPKGKNLISGVFAPIGYACAFVSPFIRILAVFGWIIHLSGTDFCIYCYFGIDHFNINHIEVISMAIVTVVTGIALVFVWIAREYKINKNALSHK